MIHKFAMFVVAGVFLVASLPAQVHVTLSMTDPDITKRIFGRWSSSRQTMWTAAITNEGSSVAVLNEAVVGSGMAELKLAWLPYPTVQAAMGERTRRHPALLVSDAIDQGAFSTLLLIALGTVQANPAVAAAVGIGSRALPTFVPWIRKSTPETMQNLKGFAPTVLRLDAGVTSTLTVWTSLYAPTRATYVFDIPARRLPGAGVLNAVAAARRLDPSLSEDAAAENLLALIGARPIP